MSKFGAKDEMAAPSDASGRSGGDYETRESNEAHASRGASSGKRGSGYNAAPQSSELTLSDVVDRVRSLFAIVRSRWLTGFIASILISGGFGYYVLQSKPEHTAVSTMLAQSALDELLSSNTGARTGQKDSQENFLQNHLTMMQSRRFSVALANQFADDERAVIVEPFMELGQEASLDSFIHMLATRSGAARQRDREFFTLSFRHPDPGVAIMVADRMTATYLKLVQQEIKETNLAAAEMLRFQAEQLQSEISQLEGKQREFRAEHNIVSLEEGHGLLAERLQRIDKNRSESRIKRFQLGSQLKDAKRDMAEDGLPFENLYLANFANSRQLRQELDSLNAERKVMALRYGRNHPKMREIDGQIKGIEGNLKRNFDFAYRDLENQYQSLVAVEQQLDKEFGDEFGDGIEIGHLANQFLVIGSEVDAKREALKDLLRRVSNAVVMSNLPAHVMRVVDPAFIAKPKLATQKIASIFALFLAGGAFFGIPLGLHLFDQRIKPATDIEKELGKMLLGGVSRLAKINLRNRPHLVRDNIDPSKVEPLMAIIAQLELLSAQKGSKLFFITSTTTGEGKSTLSSNIAAGFAQMGRKTLLVDNDLRRPCLHQFNRIRSTGGLLKWAEAGFPKENLLGEDSLLGIQELVDGSYLLPAGGIHPQPTPFFVSDNFEYLFNQLMGEYDVVIVDTPPAGLYPDALALAQSGGETVLIAREATAGVAQIRRVIADIENTDAPILGVVLNDYSSGSLNPRLAYGSAYDKYKYLKKKRDNNTVPNGGKSLVGQLMAEGKGSNDVAGTIGKPASRSRRSKSRLAKSLVGKLMKEEKGKSPKAKKKGPASPTSNSLISKLMSDDRH